MIFAQYDDDDTDFSFDNELNKKKKRSEEEEEEEGDKQSTVKRYNGDRWMVKGVAYKRKIKRRYRIFFLIYRIDRVEYKKDAKIERKEGGKRLNV